MSIVAGFFSNDAVRVQAALELIASGASNGAVLNVDTMYPTTDGIAFTRGGLFDAKIFGKTEAEHRARFGHIAVHELIHPIAFRLARRPLLESELRSVAIGKLAIRAGEVVAPEKNNPRGDLIGPPGLLEYLRATDSSHPALPFCGIGSVPVLPRATRPLVRDLGPTMDAPWIGPVNERYIELIARADTESAQWTAQAALLALFDELVRPRLSPALAEVPERLRDEDVLALAWVGDALVVQRCDHVSVVGLDGVVRLRAEASACWLRGIVDGRHAVFQGFFDATADYDLLEASVLDLETGAYRAFPPPAMPGAFIEESYEGLILASLGDGPVSKTLRYGGREPRLLAHTNDLRFAWVGEPGISTALIELATGIPHALPLEPAPVSGDPGASAVAFSDGAWHLLWPDGIIADVRGQNRVQLAVPVRTAAFSIDGRTLAVVTPNDDEILLVDRATGAVRSRMPLPR